MKIGHWNISDKEISWAGNEGNSFVINRATLLETEIGREGAKMYSWLVQATDEEWLTEDALYDLNFAFVFVAGQNPAEFDYDILEDTLDYQYESREGDEEEYDEEEEEDDDDED